jgi:hypothetical protein
MCGVIRTTLPPGQLSVEALELGAFLPGLGGTLGLKIGSSQVEMHLRLRYEFGRQTPLLHSAYLPLYAQSMPSWLFHNNCDGTCTDVIRA